MKLTTKYKRFLFPPTQFSYGNGGKIGKPYILLSPPPTRFLCKNIRKPKNNKGALADSCCFGPNCIQILSRIRNNYDFHRVIPVVWKLYEHISKMFEVWPVWSPTAFASSKILAKWMFGLNPACRRHIVLNQVKAVWINYKHVHYTFYL